MLRRIFLDERQLEKLKNAEAKDVIKEALKLIDVLIEGFDETILIDHKHDANGETVLNILEITSIKNDITTIEKVLEILQAKIEKV